MGDVHGDTIIEIKTIDLVMLDARESSVLLRVFGLDGTHLWPRPHDSHPTSIRRLAGKPATNQEHGARKASSTNQVEDSCKQPRFKLTARDVDGQRLLMRLAKRDALSRKHVVFVFELSTNAQTTSQASYAVGLKFAHLST